MAGKNIAFVGAPDTWQRTFSFAVVDMLEGHDRFHLNSNTQRKIIDRISEEYVEEYKDSEELDLTSAFSRRMEMLSIPSNRSVISDDWALYELAKTLVRMQAVQEKINSSPQLMDSSGKTIMTADHGQLIVLQAVFQVIINQVSKEKDFWDFIYYVPVYEPEDGMIDEEGTPPKEKLYQKEVDNAILSLIEQLGLSVVKLPNNIDDAFAFLETEKEKWTE